MFCIFDRFCLVVFRWKILHLIGWMKSLRPRDKFGRAYKFKIKEEKKLFSLMEKKMCPMIPEGTIVEIDVGEHAVYYDDGFQAAPVSIKVNSKEWEILDNSDISNGIPLTDLDVDEIAMIIDSLKDDLKDGHHYGLCH